MLIIGTKSKSNWGMNNALSMTLGPFWRETINEDHVIKTMSLQKLNESDMLKVYGHLVFRIKDRLFVMGGYYPDQPKISTMACYDGHNYENHLWTRKLSEDLKWLFAAGSIDNSQNNKQRFLRFGGRKSPFDCSSDLHAIDYEGSMNRIDLKQARARWGHTVHSISDHLYLIGGRDLHMTLDTIEEFKVNNVDVEQQRCTKLKFGIYGHASSIFKEKIVISGGLKNSTRCDVNKQLIIYNPKEEENNHNQAGMPLRYIDVDNYFPRFNHTSHVTNGGVLIQVGGVVMSSYDVVITSIDLKTCIATNFQPDIPPAVPLVNHCSILCDDQEIKIFGGGTNCKFVL